MQILTMTSFRQCGEFTCLTLASPDSTPMPTERWKHFVIAAISFSQDHHHHHHRFVLPEQLQVSEERSDMLPSMLTRTRRWVSLSISYYADVDFEEKYCRTPRRPVVAVLHVG